MARGWPPRMTKATAAAVGVLVLLVVAAGLYASGPKYAKFIRLAVSAPGVESHTANVTLRPGSPLVAAVSKIAAREIGERSLAEALAFVAAQTPRL